MSAIRPLPILEALAWRSTLEPIGCWPPKCHVCEKVIAPEERVSMKPVETKNGKGQALFAIVHATCLGGKPEEPTEAVLAAQADGRERSGGAFLTLEEIDLLPPTSKGTAP